MFMWLKHYMPRSLYGRAALILVLPVVAVQLVVSFLFIRNHLEDVTTQMTFNAVSAIEVAMQRVAEAESEAQAQALAARACARPSRRRRCGWFVSCRRCSSRT